MTRRTKRKESTTSSDDLKRFSEITMELGNVASRNQVNGRGCLKHFKSDILAIVLGSS